MRKNYFVIGTIVVLFLSTMFYFGDKSDKKPEIHVYNDAAYKNSKSSESIKGTVTHTQKEYTIMIYMNGSDLESKYGAATADLIEMAKSRFDSKNINLLIFTGGCTNWHIKGIPDNENTIFEMKGHNLTTLSHAGTESTGEPHVLSDFIKFCQTRYPAKNYGLILWNHGGGAVVGYGADERYEDNPEKAVMKLRDIDDALSVITDENKLEFLGFDTCLMATLEMANIAKKYANYLIASEDVEPEHGWDYGFLGKIKPGDTGREIGKYAIDYYKNFYQADLSDFITLSMTDLSKVDALSQSFENFAAVAGSALDEGQFNRVSHARSRTRSFGCGGEDGDTDMVDVRELALRMSHIFPEQSSNLIRQLGDAVCYKYENRQENTGGLSVYFPFYNKVNLEHNIETYRSMSQLPNYTEFISEFSGILDSAPLHNFYGDRSLALYRSGQSNEIKLTEEQLDFL